jgi:hypothetical protein
MPMSPGVRLGPYQIERAIGAGGMGVRERFEREARTISQLNHPHIWDESAIWTSDGKRLTFAASRSGKPRQTLWKAADGSGVEETLFTSKTHQHLSSWTSVSTHPQSR